MLQGSLEHALRYGTQLMAEFCNTQAMELLPQVQYDTVQPGACL